MQKISAIIITLNEEQNIQDCLESVKWTDEIIIIDSNSKDKTVEIAKKYTDNIFTTDENYFSNKRNLALNKASCDWILWLDADERITNELKSEIQEVLNNNENKIAGYLIKRKTFFINKFIKHCGWYPDYSLRLFKKSHDIKFDDSRVHEKVIYNPDSIGTKLKSPIIHYTDKTFEHYIKKLNLYTTYSSLDLKDQNKTSSYKDIFLRPVLTFFTMYFLKLGFLDGYMGLVLCTLSSISVFIKYSKLYFLNLSN